MKTAVKITPESVLCSLRKSLEAQREKDRKTLERLGFHYERTDTKRVK